MQVKHEKEAFAALSREERTDRHLSKQHHDGKQPPFTRDEHHTAVTANTCKTHDSAARGGKPAEWPYNKGALVYQI